MKHRIRVANGEKARTPDPYTNLVVGILRQAVSDAVGAGFLVQRDKAKGQHIVDQAQLAAQEFLNNKDGALEDWLDLVNVELLPIQRMLLQAVKDKRNWSGRH